MNVRLYASERSFTEKNELKELEALIGDEIGSSANDPVIVFGVRRFAPSLLISEVPTPPEILTQDGLLTQEILRTAPDAQRRAELLPETVDISNDELFFVNRNDSTKALLRVLKGYRTFRKNKGAGSGIKLALVDSAYGMGKTSFCQKLLALTGESDFGFTSRAEIEFLAEIRKARTVLIRFSDGDLLNSMNREKVMINVIQDAWDTQFPEMKTDKPFNLLKALMKWIVSFTPIFLILDEIGLAFVSPQLSLTEQRERFLGFLRKECVQMLMVENVYFVLCGRAPFLAHVGLRPGNEPQATATPFGLERITLNPIRREYIMQILANTLKNSRSISDIIKDLPGRDVAEYAKELYAATGGHPRSMLAILKTEAMDPRKRLRSSPFHLEEVRFFVQLYPIEMRELYDHHIRQSTVDLTEVSTSNWDAYEQDKSPTYEYLLSRLHGGHGMDVTRTQVFLPPPVERLLERLMLPLSDFLHRWSKRDLLLAHDKGRDFESVICKWFECTFSNPKRIGDVLQGFLPVDSVLSTVTLRARTVHIGRKILSPKQSTEADGIAVALGPLAEELKTYTNQGTVDMYFPAPFSHSPDLIILPNATDGTFVIGVAIKCLNSDQAYSRTLIDDERNKFAILLEHMAAHGTYKGVLFICYTAPCPEAYTNERASIAKSAEYPDMEVVVWNLGSPESRRAFFGIVPNMDENHFTILKNMITS
jgi:hypothetical protein